MIFCFLRASASRFCVSYLNLPKSMILQTGGTAVGEISTKIKAGLFGHLQGAGGGHHPDVFAIRTDQADFG
jgi:hypothetical protein